MGKDETLEGSMERRISQTPVPFNALEVVHDGNAQPGYGVQHSQHHHIQGQCPKQGLQSE